MGTVYIRITRRLMHKYIRTEIQNALLLHLFRDHGWSIYDFRTGIEVIDDDLYYCQTDGELVDVSGNLIEPELLLVDFSPDEVQDFIVDGTLKDCELLRYETLNVPSYDLDATVVEMLTTHYSFRQVVDLARDLDLID